MIARPPLGNWNRWVRLGEGLRRTKKSTAEARASAAALDDLVRRAFCCVNSKQIPFRLLILENQP